MWSQHLRLTASERLSSIQLYLHSVRYNQGRFGCLRKPGARPLGKQGETWAETLLLDLRTLQKQERKRLHIPFWCKYKYLARLPELQQERRQNC